MKDGSLTIVGSGIKFISHLTNECKIHIEQSEIVLFLVNEPAIKEWIQKINPNSYSLENVYRQYTYRLDSYQAITDYILEMLREEKHVCVVFYGHPTVLAKPGIDAVRQAKIEGFSVKILPGISAEACLFADLLINPGEEGCLSLEATDLLIHRKKLDPSNHLIIWQASIIGMLTHTNDYDNHKGIELLTDYLSDFYDLNHRTILYSAALYPGMEPSVQQFELKKLPFIKQNRIALLYLPPISIKRADPHVLNILDIKTAKLNYLLDKP